MKYKNGAIINPSNACQIKSFKRSCGSSNCTRFTAQRCRRIIKRIQDALGSQLPWLTTELDPSGRAPSVSTSTAQMTGLLHPGLALLHVLSGFGVLCQSWGILLVWILHITCNPLKMSPLLALVLSPLCPDSAKIQWEGQISLRFQIAMIWNGTCHDPQRSNQVIPSESQQG